jgi:transposase
VGKYVEARITASTVEILFKGQRVASHVRSHVRNGFSTQPEHRPAHHQKYGEWTPERIIGWAGKTGPNTALLAEAIMTSRDHREQGMRACMGIIRLARVFGKDRLEAASAKALEIKAYSYRTVETILKNGMDRNKSKKAKRTEPVEHDNVRGPEQYN